MQGAMILVAGTLIAKLISAAFKIPLQHYIGNTCMGIFNSAYQYYTIMFVIATAGVPVALSKLVSEANALGRGEEVKRIARLAGVTFFSFGALCSIALFFGADIIAKLSNNPMAIQAIRAISPAVFFVSIVAVVRGYFQGMSNMIPTALSQIIEASGKVVLGLIFAYFAGVKGFDDAIKAAFAILGVTIGEVLAAVVMLFYALSAKTQKNNFWKFFAELVLLFGKMFYNRGTKSMRTSAMQNKAHNFPPYHIGNAPRRKLRGVSLSSRISFAGALYRKEARRARKP